MLEIRLSEMTKQEAFDLDRRLAYCASMALREAIEDKHNNESGEDITSEGIDQLFSIFKKSLFVNEKDNHLEHVKERLQIELSRHIPSSDPVRQELLMPIMAYTLLVNNEFNTESVRKRIANDAKNVPHKKGEYPYNRWHLVNPYTITRSIKPPKSTTFDSKLAALKYAIKNQHDYRYCNSHDTAYVYALLKNYPFLVCCQDLAKIALFLRDILTHTHNGNRPMNSLIRMYIANHLDNIFLRSYSLCDDNYADAIRSTTPNSYLLSHYYNLGLDGKWNIINGSYKPSLPYDMQHTPPNLCFKETYNDRSFADVYLDLTSNYSISENDLGLLLDFYLDKHLLSEYANLVDNTSHLATSIIKNINYGIEIPNNALTITMTNLALWIMHSRKAKPPLHISHKFRGKWKGEPIARYLCSPRIYDYKPKE